MAEELGKRASPGRGALFVSVRTYLECFLRGAYAYKEFKDSSPILAYSGYAIAAFVAGSRLYNNRHWVADVVAGAGFGILSVELSYLIYFPIRNAIARRINRNVKNCPIVAAPVFSSNMADSI